MLQVTRSGPMRILLATDGSNDAKVAVEWLRHLPLPPDREMLVITAVSPPVLPVELDMLSELQRHEAMVSREGRRFYP